MNAERRQQLRQLAEACSYPPAAGRADWDAFEKEATPEVVLALLDALDQAEEALEAFANPQHWGIRRQYDGHPDAMWIGTYQQSPIDFARAALAALKGAPAGREQQEDA